ncbi:FadR/GntR family transcriptional regulator [Alloyangia pacifica]|uniref:DNA-binding transcriptional regulator, FadR family n=1 Tax=Alloyangia pacifica TaxID=311180 RepID=A0A1I6WGR2_9RHOB|nr:FadR/GntR family transcriptional regulator [Alloyangia pacifica]SDI74319.1 DNA-binding transcriptional regulator, FadR family [Alloyangia pacifica]SFT25183.1 DNA-binding transcriptional regulator, FadR family [Alloyangia pacifica]
MSEFELPESLGTDGAAARPAKASEALDTLGRRIVTGEYTVGETLPVEASLMDDLGVSRTTLRESIRTLVALGLVEVRTRIGTRVLPRKHWNLLNRDVLRWMMPLDGFNVELMGSIDEAREVFEPAAAAFAAERASRSAVTSIRVAYDKMAAAAESGDVVAAIRADREFHLAILSSTGNPIIEAFDTALDAVLGQLFRVAIEMHMENFRNNLINHRNVLDAIERKDAAAARQAMLDTIWFTRRHLERHNLTKPFS